MIDAKRLIDIILSFIGLIAFLPLLLLISSSTFLTQGSPIFFIQERPGKNGKLFKLIKFRTMRTQGSHSEEDQHRITKIGRILRKSSLDELPELYNVLKGDMSLVGPRPLLVEYLDLYSQDELRRHDVRPGITGWDQVNGRNAISWNEKFLLDIWYVDNKTLFLDLKILLMTLKKIIRKEGISADGHATMPKFEGHNEK